MVPREFGIEALELTRLQKRTLLVATVRAHKAEVVLLTVCCLGGMRLSTGVNRCLGGWPQTWRVYMMKKVFTRVKILRLYENVQSMDSHGPEPRRQLSAVIGEEAPDSDLEVAALVELLQALLLSVF